MTRRHTLERLRDAAAQGRLLVISGAGISSRLKRSDGTYLPSWHHLVEELWKEADPQRLSSTDRVLLRTLMPVRGRDRLPGDALIEASEILKKGFDKGEFEKAIARLCTERPGETSDTHRAIASLAPAGIMTFNYDSAHETASRERGAAPLQRLLYSNDDGIKSLLARRGPGDPFLLKAHGCTTNPASLVLTGGSYRQVLSNYRPYRLLVQYLLVHYTALIVGFALRDRDFDQLLGTLEMELGAPTQRHVFIARRPEDSVNGREQKATWAAISARFGLDPLYVPEFSKIPETIQSLGTEPGPHVKTLVHRAGSRSRSVRQAAHDEMGLLGEIGQRQVRTGLLRAIEGEADLRKRSELIYALPRVSDGEPEVTDRLTKELAGAASSFASSPDPLQIECAAHALVVLRRGRLHDVAQRRKMLEQLRGRVLQDRLVAMDEFLRRSGGIPRLVDYARAAAAEIESRA